MSTYEDDHSIPHDSDPTTGTNPSQPSHYAARDAPRTFEEFMAELQRIVGAVRFGEERNTQGRRQPDGGGLMMDEDLYDEVFGNMDTFGGNVRGASKDFIDSLPRVAEDDVDATPDDDEQNQTCPICLLSYAQILTEQEYAEASDYHVGGDVEEMGLRRLPCGTRDGTERQGKGHIVCGKCAGKWLRLNNTCPLCRSTMDPSVSSQDQTGQANYTEPMLQLFRSVFGHAREEGIQAGLAGVGEGGPFGVRVQAMGERPDEDDEFNSMYS